MKKLEMVNKEINASIIADSLNEHNNRITTYVLTYPRIIHAELLTHRLFSRNAASSRAIPASKMIEDIEEDPFIPVAFQKAHSGMQGTKYIENAFDLKVAKTEWLCARDEAVHRARNMVNQGITKQLVNRILEPYQWYTCIVTCTELDNFFQLRCPRYEHQCYIRDTDKPHDESFLFYSRKDWLNWENSHKTDMCYNVIGGVPKTDLDWLKINQSQSEIHISLLAEAMWDSLQESEPKQLESGEWHIPFGDKMDEGLLGQYVPEFSTGPSFHSKMWNLEIEKIKIKIATARCGRISYLNFEGKDDYEADIKLYDRLLSMRHMSPFEHCARAMSDEEFWNDDRGIGMSDKNAGWSGNFRGFVQLRKEIE